MISGLMLGENLNKRMLERSREMLGLRLGEMLGMERNSTEMIHLSFCFLLGLGKFNEFICLN